jgi:putative ABC transport system permease protein
MFLAKLATSNIRKKMVDYAPFLFAGIATVILNMVMSLTKNSPAIADRASVVQVLGFGEVIIKIITVLFMLYAYSFLQNGRRKEYGLYNILGMSKSEIIQLSFIENVLTFAIVVVVGEIVGILFAQILFMFLIKLIGGGSFALGITAKPFIDIAAFYLGVFALLFIVGSVGIARNKAVDLFKSDQAGEKEPKGNLFVTALGLVGLGVAYYIALSVQSPIEAIFKFFIAVILVIIATYLLFITGSIFVLKVLRKNEGLYYQPAHFITISSMIFRMKKNAVGLANIAILSTMTLVTLLTTVEMYVGMDDLSNKLYPKDVVANYMAGGQKHTLAEEVANIETVAKSRGVAIKDLTSYTVSPSAWGRMDKNGVFTSVRNGNGLTNMSEVEFMTEASFNAQGNDLAPLGVNQVAIYDMSGEFTYKTFTLDTQKFDVLKVYKRVKGIQQGTMNVFPKIMVIVKDADVLAQFPKNVFTTASVDDVDFTTQIPVVMFNVAGNVSDAKLRALTVKMSENSGMSFALARENKAELKESVGVLLFIGSILGLSFILATGLIIYYKQISEGAMDQKRFDILQKVGMTHDEVKKTINSQIVWIFVLPLAVASIHLGFAMPMITKILQMFGLTNHNLILITAIAFLAVFVLIYFLIYKQTSKVYYRQVERRA